MRKTLMWTSGRTRPTSGDGRAWLPGCLPITSWSTFWQQIVQRTARHFERMVCTDPAYVIQQVCIKTALTFLWSHRRADVGLHDTLQWLHYKFNCGWLLTMNYCSNSRLLIRSYFTSQRHVLFFIVEVVLWKTFLANQLWTSAHFWLLLCGIRFRLASVRA